MEHGSYARSLRGKSLAGLRAARERLQAEELRVSFWRRLVQGRLDLVRAALAGEGAPPSVGDLARLAVAWPDTAPRRSPAAACLVPDAGAAALHGLDGFWDTPLPWDQPARLRELERLLVEAEVELSAYRRLLHQRLDACTAELVARYRRDPELVTDLLAPP